jgi:hypothetical protein
VGKFLTENAIKGMFQNGRAFIDGETNAEGESFEFGGHNDVVIVSRFTI